MAFRTRLAKLEARYAPKPEYRSITQIVREDGVATPSDEEVERRFAEWRAEGIEPNLIQIQVVRGPGE